MKVRVDWVRARHEERRERPGETSTARRPPLRISGILPGKQFHVFDEHQRLVFADGEINVERTYGNTMNLHAQSWQSVERLTNDVGIELESFNNMPKGRRNRLSLARPGGSALELAECFRDNRRANDLVIRPTVFQVRHA